MRWVPIRVPAHNHDPLVLPIFDIAVLVDDADVAAFKKQIAH
jgi:hypothetical protein